MSEKEIYENLYNKFQNKDYDGALSLLNDLKRFKSADEIQDLKFRIVNKGGHVSGYNNEEALLLFYQALEIRPDNELVKQYLFQTFKRAYIKKLNDEKYEEIPGLVNKALNWKSISEEMKNYLKTNKYISDFFEYLYIKKNITIIEKYKSSIKNFLEYLCQCTDDINYKIAFTKLVNDYMDNISKDSNFFIKKKEESNDLSLNNEKEEKELLELYDAIMYEIYPFIKKYKDNKKIIELKSWIIFRFSEIYFENKNYKVAQKLINDFLYLQRKENLDYRQVLANINLSKIKLNEQKFIEGYTIVENLLSSINKKLKENKGIDIKWPNEELITDINIIKIDCLLNYIDSKVDEIDFRNLERYFKIFLNLITEAKDDISNFEAIEIRYKCLKIKSIIKYIEDKLDEFEFINLEPYFMIAFDLFEETKGKIDLEEFQNELQNFLIEYKKKELKHFKEKKKYIKCKELCDLFIKTYHCENHIIREIKQIKLDCLKNISDNLMKENEKEELMK